MADLTKEEHVWLTAYCAALATNDPNKTSLVNPAAHERASEAADAALYTFLKKWHPAVASKHKPDRFP